MGQRALLAGRYELGAPLGSGGFGTVYRARDRETDQDVAVKLVPPGFDASRLVERLRHEALILERLKHLSSRHLARILDVGEDVHGVWLVSELIDGAPLSASALGRALLPHEVLRVARGILEGLSVAHSEAVVHADLKPSNILVPRTKYALDGPKIIDFGLSRVTLRSEIARDLGQPASGDGVVFGSARWMAPEVLAGESGDMRSDVYSVGLVLFELLGVGELFAAADRRERLRARVHTEPELDSRVALPLSFVLGGMLARDPEARFQDASEALMAVVDLDTAPVATDAALDERPFSGRRRSSKPSFSFAMSSAPPPQTTAVAPPPLVNPAATDLIHYAPKGGSTGPRIHLSSMPARRTSSRPPPGARLQTLPEDPTLALLETLFHLDVPMIDALARRERGGPIGRVARAVSLSLRLELDASALIVEPLLSSSDVARAVGVAIVAPRARRATRARVDPNREDSWLDTVPVELAVLLTVFAAALSGTGDPARELARAERITERLTRHLGHTDGPGDAETRARLESWRGTLQMALITARTRCGVLAPQDARELVLPVLAIDVRGQSAFERVVRPLLAAAVGVRIDEGRARDDLECAVRGAAECGATLLEACASAAWGRLLVDAPRRIDQGLAVLERTTTLLAHGDAPSLEHEAQHHRAAALIVAGRWADALSPLALARAAARAERALESEVLSASLELIARLALGESDSANEASSTLGGARIGTAKGRAAALAWVAKCLEALAAGEREAAEDALAEATARSCEVRESDADAIVLVEILTILFDALKGIRIDVVAQAEELERFAVERGFSSYYWLDVLGTVLERIEDDATRLPMQDALGRIVVLLGPAGRSAGNRRTSAPPPPESFG